MSNDTRKAVLNAKHEIEIKSIDALDAIQDRYKGAVANAKKTRKEEIAGVKLKERNDLRAAVIRINADAEQVRKETHKADVNRLRGSDNVPGSSDPNETGKGTQTPTTGTTGDHIKGVGKANDGKNNNNTEA